MQGPSWSFPKTSWETISVDLSKDLNGLPCSSTKCITFCIQRQKKWSVPLWRALPVASSSTFPLSPWSFTSTSVPSHFTNFFLQSSATSLSSPGVKVVLNEEKATSPTFLYCKGFFSLLTSEYKINQATFGWCSKFWALAFDLERFPEEFISTKRDRVIWVENVDFIPEKEREFPGNLEEWATNTSTLPAWLVFSPITRSKNSCFHPHAARTFLAYELLWLQ